MLNKLVDSRDTSFFTVFGDLTSIEVISLEVASKFKPVPLFIIEKLNKGITKSLFNSDFFAHSDYSLYNTDLLHYEIEENGWRVIKIDEVLDRSRQVNYHISDPNGEIKNISNYDLNKSNWKEYFQIEGICKIVAFIRKLGKYPNWAYYLLESENYRLKKEIELLRLKITDLEVQNNN